MNGSGVCFIDSRPLINPQPADSTMLGQRLVMHVRGCGATVRVPFAADSLTKARIPAARTHVWTVEVTNNTFVYQLEREGTSRRFRVEFDLRTPVTPPPAR